MKRRNNCNGKYYVISNPLPVNEKTGNFAISPTFYLNNDKDYLFEWRNPDTNVLETKVLSKEYVKNHAKPCVIKKWDEFFIEKEFKGYCFLISYKDIMSY